MSKGTGKRTADGAYWQHRNRIAGRIDEIRKALDEHGKRQRSSPTDWGYAGDAAHIDEQLVEILAFMRPDPEEPWMGHDGIAPKPETHARAKVRILGVG